MRKTVVELTSHADTFEELNRHLTALGYLVLMVDSKNWTRFLAELERATAIVLDESTQDQDEPEEWVLNQVAHHWKRAMLVVGPHAKPAPEVTRPERLCIHHADQPFCASDARALVGLSLSN